MFYTCLYIEYSMVVFESSESFENIFVHVSLVLLS